MPCSPTALSFMTFTCESAAGECLTSGDCPDGHLCARLPSGNRCEELVGSCGRPFLIDGAPRLASTRYGSADWAGPLDCPASALSDAGRAILAQHWTKLGLMEHASVGAFARFTLELLALGAPADLVRAAHEALGDEIEHTKLCFDLASSFAGHRVGPGPLPVNGALAETSREHQVITAFLEACLGETLAAVEAHLAADKATAPAVQAVLETIAKDEAKHAELGWRFLGWSLAEADTESRERLLGALGLVLAAELRREVSSRRSSAETTELASFGMPALEDRMRARRAALHEVVVPCAAALGIRVERLGDRAA